MVQDRFIGWPWSGAGWLVVGTISMEVSSVSFERVWRILAETGMVTEWEDAADGPVPTCCMEQLQWQGCGEASGVASSFLASGSAARRRYSDPSTASAVPTMGAHWPTIRTESVSNLRGSRTRGRR
jgi:hypothetical protein